MWAYHSSSRLSVIFVGVVLKGLYQKSVETTFLINKEGELTKVKKYTGKIIIIIIIN